MNADQLRALRRRLGVTQAGFAELYHLPLRTIQEWEQGRASIPIAGKLLLYLIDQKPDLVASALQRFRVTRR